MYKYTSELRPDELDIIRGEILSISCLMFVSPEFFFAAPEPDNSPPSLPPGSNPPTICNFLIIIF
jgi:hypothetical protein